MSFWLSVTCRTCKHTQIQVNFSNFWGGLLFMMSGFWGYAYESISVWQWRVQNLIGFGVGAVVCSTLASRLLCFRPSCSLLRCALQLVHNCWHGKLCLVPDRLCVFPCSSSPPPACCCSSK
jgi:hypothetical protein